jgi:aryl-alcohol dehydrogenase-like predicted oxidoreductase
MDKRFWAGLNKESNVFGFGCWQIAGNHKHNGVPNGWGDITEKQAIDLLCYAIENGIDFYDTAQGYNFGRSERLLGIAIKQTKKDVIICTKIKLTDKELSENKIGLDFKLRVFESIKNLNTPFIDIILIHNPPDDLNWKSFNYEILQDLVNERIIGTFGVSSKGLSGAINVIENNVGNTLEWVFNIFERRPINVLFPTLKAKKINFIARSPLNRGLINPFYLKNIPYFDSNDFRSTLPKEWISWVINSLKSYHLNGVSENEIIKNALTFCAQFKEVSATILGIKTKFQLEHYLSISRSEKSGLKKADLINIPEFYPTWA